MSRQRRGHSTRINASRKKQRALGGGSVQAEGYCRETTEDSQGDGLRVTARKVAYTLDTLAAAGGAPCALLTIAARVTGDSVTDPLLRAWGVTAAGDTMPLNGAATPWQQAGLTILPAASSPGDRVLFGLALLSGFALVGWMFRRPFSHPERSRKAGAAR